MEGKKIRAIYASKFESYQQENVVGNDKGDLLTIKERNREGGREGRKERREGERRKEWAKEKGTAGNHRSTGLDISNYKIAMEDSEIWTHTYTHFNINVYLSPNIQVLQYFVLLVKKPIHCWMDKPKFVLFGTTEERPNLGFSSQLPYLTSYVFPYRQHSPL